MNKRSRCFNRLWELSQSLIFRTYRLVLRCIYALPRGFSSYARPTKGFMWRLDSLLRRRKCFLQSTRPLCLRYRTGYIS